MSWFSHRFLSDSGTRSRRAVSLGLALGLFASVNLMNGCISRSLTGLTIEPSTGNTTIVPGVTAQFKAIGTYTENGHETTTEDLTDQVQWSTTIPDVATVNAQGLVTGVGSGITSVLASIPGAFGNLTAVSNVTVNAPSGGGATTRTLSAVTMIPTTQQLTAVGEQAQFLVIGTYNTAPTSSNLTGSSSWESSDPSIATVESSTSPDPGLVTAVGAGTATITALATGPDGAVVQATATVVVNLAASTQATRTLTAVNVTPGSQTLTEAGQTAQLLAIGSFTASPLSSDLTDTATWQSSDTSIATVNSTGLVTAVAPGSATITAVGTGSDGSIYAGDAVVTVESSTPVTRDLTGLQVIPQTQSVTTTGETTQFIAIGTYNVAPLTEDLTNQVTWVSSDPQVATVNNAGLATTTGATVPAETTITALATDSNGSVLSASGTLQMVLIQGSSGSGGSTLPTLSVYGAGSGSGTVTSSPGAISCSYTGPANGVGAGTQSTAQCTGSFTPGTTVTLTETPGTGTMFDGWSGNCAPVTTSPTDPYSGHYTECTITVTDNETVGAIFDPQ